MGKQNREVAQNQPAIFFLKQYGLFSSKKFYKMDTTTLLFVFDKYYPIID